MLPPGTRSALKATAAGAGAPCPRPAGAGLCCPQSHRHAWLQTPARIKCSPPSLGFRPHVAAAISRVCSRMAPPEVEGFPEPSLSAVGDRAESAFHRPGVREAPSGASPGFCRGPSSSKAVSFSLTGPGCTGGRVGGGQRNSRECLPGSRRGETE